MELISKEVVKRIIDSERTREQMLEMLESAVAVDSSTDCISREKAISSAKFIFESDSTAKAFCMMKMLEELPSVKPKERTGEWINIINQDLHDYRTGNKLCFECSNCKSQFTYSSNYCPNCGRSMMAESEEEE